MAGIAIGKCSGKNVSFKIHLERFDINGPYRQELIDFLRDCYVTSAPEFRYCGELVMD